MKVIIFNNFVSTLTIKIFTVILVYSCFSPNLSYSQCGTLHNFYLNKDSLCKTGILRVKKHNSLQVTERGERDFLQTFIDSPNGRFRIHYDTIGLEAVPTLDKNVNNIPDYVDSVLFYINKTYDFQVKELGYLDPTLRDGIQEKNGGSAAFDIYIRQLGDYKSCVVTDPGYYGYVSNEQVYEQVGNVRRYTSFMVIDNDYSALDTSFKEDNVTKKRSYNTYGYDAIKVVLAHEFHHAIQFAYALNNYMIMTEAYSTFLEWRMYPEIRDYEQYVYALLAGEGYSFLKSITDVRNYAFSTFVMYTYLKYGDNFWLHFWQRYGEGQYDFRILEDLLNQKNNSLQQTWIDYANLFYFTNSRYNAENILIPAKNYPLIKFYDLDTFITPSLNLTLPMKPFTFSASRVIFNNTLFSEEQSNDTLDLFFVNADTTALFNGDFQTTYRYNIDISDLNNTNPEFTRLGKSNYFIKENLDSTRIFLTKHFYQGENTSPISTVIPNPLNINDANATFIIPVNENYPLYKKVDVQIYTSDMILVYEKNDAVISSYDKYRGIVLNTNDVKLESGIYLFKVTLGEDVNLGKFAVVNK